MTRYPAYPLGHPWSEATELERRRVYRETVQDLLAGGYSRSDAEELARLAEEWADELDPRVGP